MTVTGVTRFSSEILLLTWTIDAEDTINSMKRLANRSGHNPSPVVDLVGWFFTREIRMKAWKIDWIDSNGQRQSRFRSSKRTALTRATRANKEAGSCEGDKAKIEHIEIPTSRFELIDFLNGQMDLVSKEAA